MGQLATAASTISKDDFQWAYLACVTHCFGLHLNDPQQGGVVKATSMVPVADACNTDRDPNVYWTVDHSGGRDKLATFQLTTVHELAAGTEILVPYAGKINGYTNEDYADEWGFIMSDSNATESVDTVETWSAEDNRCRRVASLPSKSPEGTSPTIWKTFFTLARERCPASNITASAQF